MFRTLYRIWKFGILSVVGFFHKDKGVKTYAVLVLNYFSRLMGD